MKYLALFFFSFTITSCVYHTGLITSSTVSNDKANCEYSDIAIGYKKVSYLFRNWKI